MFCPLPPFPTLITDNFTTAQEMHLKDLINQDPEHRDKVLLDTLMLELSSDKHDLIQDYPTYRSKTRKGVSLSEKGVKWFNAKCRGEWMDPPEEATGECPSGALRRPVLWRTGRRSRLHAIRQVGPRAPCVEDPEQTKAYGMVTDATRDDVFLAGAHKTGPRAFEVGDVVVDHAAKPGRVGDVPRNGTYPTGPPCHHVANKLTLRTGRARAGRADAVMVRMTPRYARQYAVSRLPISRTLGLSGVGSLWKSCEVRGRSPMAPTGGRMTGVPSCSSSRTARTLGR